MVYREFVIDNSDGRFSDYPQRELKVLVEYSVLAYLKDTFGQRVSDLSDADLLAYADEIY